jgi:hypothetical protein
MSHRTEHKNRTDTQRERLHCSATRNTTERGGRRRRGNGQHIRRSLAGSSRCRCACARTRRRARGAARPNAHAANSKVLRTTYGTTRRPISDYDYHAYTRKNKQFLRPACCMHNEACINLRMHALHHCDCKLSAIPHSPTHGGAAALKRSAGRKVRKASAKLGSGGRRMARRPEPQATPHASPAPGSGRCSGSTQRPQAR